MTILTARQRRGGERARIQTLVRIGRRALARAEHLDRLADGYYVGDDLEQARARRDANLARERGRLAAEEALAIAEASDDLDLRRKAATFQRGG